MIGSREEALAVHQRALGLFEALSREGPDEPEPRYEIGKSCIAIGRLLSGTGRRAEALAAVDRARTILRSLIEAGLADDRIQCELADAEHYYGIDCGAATDRSHERLGAYDRARAIMEALVAANPSDDRFRLELASICDSLGLVCATPAGVARRRSRSTGRANSARRWSRPTRPTRSSSTSWRGPWETGRPASR